MEKSLENLENSVIFSSILWPPWWGVILAVLPLTLHCRCRSGIQCWWSMLIVCTDLCEQDRLHAACSLDGGTVETQRSTWWLYSAYQSSETSEEDPNDSSVDTHTQHTQKSFSSWILDVSLMFATDVLASITVRTWNSMYRVGQKTICLFTCNALCGLRSVIE